VEGTRPSALYGWFRCPWAVRAHGLYPQSRVFVRDVLALRRRFSWRLDPAPDARKEGE
jgi:hypothetical protein